MGPIYYLLDTNVVSEIIKPEPDLKCISNIELRNDFCAISSHTWYELLRGMESMPDGNKKESLRNFLMNYVQASFPIIEYDEYSALLAADLYGKLKRLGKLMPEMDLNIAATAMSHAMILVTRNVKDFKTLAENSTLCVEDWFEKD